MFGKKATPAAADPASLPSVASSGRAAKPVNTLAAAGQVEEAWGV